MANQYRSVLASSGPAPTGGNALPAEVLSGKTFTNDNGAQTGTMTNNGAVSGSATPSTPYTIPEGYHNGSGTVTVNLSSEEVSQSATLTGAGTETPLYFAPASGRVLGISAYEGTTTASNTNVRNVALDTTNNRVVITIKNNGSDFAYTGKATLIIG